MCLQHPEPPFNLSLVWCPGNNFTKSLEFVEERFGGGDPDEGAGFGIVVLYQVDRRDILEQLKPASAKPMLFPRTR